MFFQKAMNRSGGSRRFENRLIFIALAILLSVISSAASDRLCKSSQVHNDSIIRIGFLSRYKSSKVSERDSMFLDWIKKSHWIFGIFACDIKESMTSELFDYTSKFAVLKNPFLFPPRIYQENVL